MLNRRYWLNAITSFLFIAAYHGAIILLPLLGIYLLVYLYLEKTLDIKAVYACLGGLIAGLVINPWFPVNVEYLLFHVLFSHANYLSGISGREWISLNLSDYLLGAYPAHFMLLMSLLYLGAGCWKSGRDILTPAVSYLLILSLMFALLYAKAWRFAEYYVPITAVLAGVLIFTESSSISRRSRIGLLVVLLVISNPFDYIADGYFDESPEKYREIASVLNTEADDGEIVFNTHWPDFVHLMWHARNQRYVTGLDGAYLLYESPEKYRFLENMKSFSMPAEAMVDGVITQFKSRWMVLPEGHGPLVQYLLKDERVSVVAASEWGWLLKITGKKHMPGHDLNQDITLE